MAILAPLPPGNANKDEASIDSPMLGMRFAFKIKSMFRPPITAITADDMADKHLKRTRAWLALYRFVVGIG